VVTLSRVEGRNDFPEKVLLVFSGSVAPSCWGNKHFLDYSQRNLCLRCFGKLEKHVGQGMSKELQSQRGSLFCRECATRRRSFNFYLLRTARRRLQCTSGCLSSKVVDLVISFPSLGGDLQLLLKNHHKTDFSFCRLEKCIFLWELFPSDQSVDLIAAAFALWGQRTEKV